MEWIKVTVLVLIVCVVKCMPMTKNEIEDFKNFLEKTSKLDQILVKKGVSPEDGVNDEETISDDAWEQSGKFEGDLILNDRQRRVIVENVAEGLSRNGLNDHTKRWPDNELVYYIQREHFTSDQVQAIQDGIDDLAQASCVKFRPYRKGDRDAVVIQGSRRGCFSNVGYQGGYQVLNLNGRHPPGRGCFRHGTIVHELLHSLGFYHMQSSPDRDDYIDVLWENIHEPAKHNFRKYNTFSVSDFGVGYDYDSVLHYGRRAFSRNGQDTLVPKQSGASIGQRVRLSDKDVKKLNKMYCDADSNNFDADDDETARKSTSVKDNQKNKPFEGHGIGYHQGKTVVIKLPAAETVKLINPPQFHLFDHFSKTPQAVPQTFNEGFGTGKEVVLNYEPVPYNKPVDRVITNSYNVPNKSVVTDANAEDEPLQTKKPQNVPVLADIDYSGKPRDIVDEAFNRLGIIIKTHVFPSQTPDLEVYKPKLDYSKYYSAKVIESHPQTAVEESSTENNYNNHQANLQLPEITGQNYNKENYSTKDYLETTPYSKTPRGFESYYNRKRKQDSSEDKEKENSSAEIYAPEMPYKNVPRGFDKTFNTAYPLRQMPKVKEEKFVTPEYGTYKYLTSKNDYSHLYRPRDSSKKGTTSLFGYLVPLPDESVNSDDIKKDNEKYDKESYTYSPGNGYENVLSKRIELDPSDAKKSIFGRLPTGNKAYSIFGVLVPLTQKWYKVDFDPHSGSYTIENPESSEDYR